MCIINGDNLEKKLDIAFAKNLGVNVNSGFKNDIDVFKEKIILLANTGRYNKLVESLLRSKDRIEFNSYVFEAYFAYDFEVNGHQLEYEVKNLSESLTSIDYCYETEGRKIYFELRVINQRAALTGYMEAQLKHYGFYEILQGGEEEQQETIRLQNSILSKCQGKEGNPND